MNRLIALFFAFVLCFSCSSEDDGLTQEQEYDQLRQQFLEIETLSKSATCTDSSEWTFTPFGSKACGGPQGFIAYSRTIDTENFLQKVSEYTRAENSYNRRWGIISDCSLSPSPTSIVCQNGAAVLLY